MSKQIDAKPTIYQGIQFKSRLEARWAVFLDGLRFEWTYEPITWIIQPHGWEYTPDFQLPDSQEHGPVLLEVKPAFPTVDVIQVLLTIQGRSEYAMALGYGSWYQGYPQVLDFERGADHCSLTDWMMSLYPEVCFIPQRIPGAAKAAAVYRFDIQED